MRKRIILVMAVVMCLYSIAFAEERTPCGNIDLTWLRTHSPIPSGQIVSKQNFGSLCEIILKIGNEYVPVFAGEDFIIAGEMLKGRKQVTKEKIGALRAESFKKLIPQFDSVAAITYSPAKNKNRKIYMITDPLCPYCGMAGEKIIPLADTYGATVKTVLYTVHGVDGEEKSIEAACRKFTLNQYAEKGWKALPFDERYRCSEGEQLIEATREVIGKTGIAGVPVFIFDNGQFVNGANMAAVEGILKNME